MDRFDALKHGWLDFRRKRFWAWVLLVLYALLGFVVAPLIVRSVIVSQVHSQLGLDATLEDVDINPFALTVRLEQFALADAKKAPLIAFDELDVNLQLSGIFNRALKLREFRIVHPYVRIERDAHSLNLRALIPPDDPNAEPEPESPPPRLIVESAVLEGGRATLIDRSGRQPYETEFGPVDLNVSELNTLPNREGDQHLVMQTRLGGHLEWTGKMTVRPFTASGHIWLSGEKVARISAYLPEDLLALIDDGVLDTSFDYEMVGNEGKLTAKVANLKLSIKDLGIAQRNETGTGPEVLRLGEFVVEGGHFAWPQRTVSIQRVALLDPQITLSRDAERRFLWDTLWQGSAAAEVPATNVADASAAVQEANANGAATAGANVPSATNANVSAATNASVAPPPTANSPPEANASTAESKNSVAAGASATETPEATGTAVAESTATATPGLNAPAAANAAVPEANTLAPSTAAPVDDAEPPWSVDIAKVEVSDGGITFADQAVNPAADIGISRLAASIESVSLADGAVMPFNIRFDVSSAGAGAGHAGPDARKSADGGNAPDATTADIGSGVDAGVATGAAANADAATIAMDGTLTAFPDLRVDAKAKIDALGLAVANPYLRETTYLQLASGALTIDGHVVSNPQEPFGFEGVLQLADLDTGLEGGDAHFLGLKRFDLNGVTVSTAQKRVDIARGELVGAFARIHISADRVLNLSELTKPAPEEPAAETPASAAASVAATADSATPDEPWGFKLARLKVVAADVDFADESLPIPFRRSISALSGTIGTFDIASRAPTHIALEGQVGEFGQLKVSGAMRALDPTQNTDIRAQFINVEMPGASPYVIRFAGHKVASGKLDLNLHYVLRDGILDGNHKIVLRDFALGEKVPYPDALDLPYGLAISLLKDSSGNIDIDLPVEGDVNDPSFRIGGVIMKALANLITSIVTAPFRLLGRLVGFGDSEDFDQIYFTAGRADLSPPEREKVAKIADALVMRPNLALTIHGVTNTEADGRALREAALRARLDARVGDADAAGRLKVVQSMAKESVPGLDQAALRAQFTLPPGPGLAPAFDETSYVNALVDKLVEAEPLPAEAVDVLAQQRAAAVRDGLAGNASLDVARLGDGDIQEVKPGKDGTVPMKLELTVH